MDRKCEDLKGQIGFKPNGVEQSILFCCLSMAWSKWRTRNSQWGGYIEGLRAHPPWPEAIGDLRTKPQPSEGNWGSGS